MPRFVYRGDVLESTYDIAATYDENYRKGPCFRSQPPVVKRAGDASFLGLAVRSRLGVAAGLLLNSKWIDAYAQRGFDILTYKTVRSSHRDCYPLPNWVFVTERDDGRYESIDPGAALSGDPSSISSSVCFGIPSMAPEVWRGDIAVAKSKLAPGQLLIVSVVATPEEHWGVDELAADFVQCAKWATEAGADIIEANLSCPNVCSAEGSIYLDPPTSRNIAGAIKQAIGQVPLLAKTGHFDDDARLSDYLAALDGVANGVTMVNCLIREVIHPDGKPVFGDTFAQAGVLGRAIHDSCVDSVHRTARIIKNCGHALEIAAVGGVSARQDMDDFLAAGADAVLLGSSPMYQPNIAADLHG